MIILILLVKHKNREHNRFNKMQTKINTFYLTLKNNGFILIHLTLCKNNIMNKVLSF